MGLPVMAIAEGQWPRLLGELAGLAPEQLQNRHQPCPACGGTDRYRWDRDDGPGGWFCNQCGGKERTPAGILRKPPAALRPTWRCREPRTATRAMAPPCFGSRGRPSGHLVQPVPMAMGRMGFRPKQQGRRRQLPSGRRAFLRRHHPIPHPRSWAARLASGVTAMPRGRRCSGSSASNRAAPANPASSLCTAPGWTGAGTPAAFSEGNLKTVVQSMFDSGSKPKIAMMSSSNKVKFSAFAGISQVRMNYSNAAEMAEIIGAADVYLSDFGKITAVPNALMKGNTNVFFINPEYAKVGFLRPFQSNELAKSGDYDRSQMLVEYTLVVSNEKAHGIVVGTN